MEKDKNKKILYTNKVYENIEECRYMLKYIAAVVEELNTYVEILERKENNGTGIQR